MRASGACTALIAGFALAPRAGATGASEEKKPLKFRVKLWPKDVCETDRVPVLRRRKHEEITLTSIGAASILN